MNLNKVAIIFSLIFSSFQVIYADYSSREDVGDFIKHMSKKHDFEASYLESIFANAPPTVIGKVASETCKAEPANGLAV